MTSIKIDRADGWSAVVWASDAGDLHRIDFFGGAWQTDFTEGFATGTASILASDFDRDGGSDLLLATSSGFQLRPSRGSLPVDGSIIETAPAHLLVLSGALSADSVDLDGDGDLDLLAVGEAGIVEGINGLEAILSSLSLDEEHDEDAEDSHISALACHDLDQDGWLDLVVTGQSVYYEPGVTWILYGGFSGSPIPSEEDAQMVLEGADIRTAEFIDVDRDGDLDLLLGAKNGIDRLLIQQAPRQCRCSTFPVVLLLTRPAASRSQISIKMESMMWHRLVTARIGSGSATVTAPSPPHRSLSHPTSPMRSSWSMSIAMEILI